MKRLLRLALCLVSFVIGIVIVELCLEFFAPVPDPYAPFKHQVQLNQYIRSEFPVNYRFNTEPEAGLPGISGPGVFSTNNAGFRGDPLTSPKPRNEFRIFIVGGSTTECFYLDDSKALNSILQKELSQRAPGNISVKVYGAGKSGDASDDHISMIVHRIVHLEPNLIIVFAGINDLTRSIYGYDYLHYVNTNPGPKFPLVRFLATEFQIPRRIFYLSRRVTPRQSEIIEFIPAKSDYQEKVRLRQSVSVSNERPRLNPGAFANNLRTIIGAAKAHGIQMVLMTQQTTWNSTVDPNVRNWQWILYRNGVTYREDFMNEALESLNDQTRQISSENSIPLYDLARSMPKSLEFFYDDVHFNENGARVAGSQLASLLLEKGLVKLPE